ncbi:MAG: LD-carboxypeptidase [Lactobacillales bacterium]|nr:LD-carboxypeptidase [Lactobacillales bacterium]
MIQKPPALQKGDQIAAITPSWGGPHKFMHRYLAGKRQIEETFRLKVIETKNALMPQEFLYTHPAERARDLMDAFLDPTIKGIFATIGGDDSIRLLPYIDFDIIRNNPKVFIGYSDPTTINLMCYKAGLVSFSGPVVMAGFGENCGMFPYTIDSVNRTLFSTDPIGEIKPNLNGWTTEMLDWGTPENQTVKRKLLPTIPRKVLQGAKPVQGHLIGGCLEVLSMCLGTSIFPTPAQFKNAILFLETSEDRPGEDVLLYFLRSLGGQGILDVLSGIIMGRPKEEPQNVHRYEATLKQVLAEWNRQDMPVLTQMDFGHTDPMFVVPIGIKAQIDPVQGTFSILENAVS